jgi:hypothetical protein
MHFALSVSSTSGFNHHLKWMWPVNDPPTLCLYSTLSRLYRRSDVAEGKLVFTRNISERQVFSAEPMPDAGVKMGINTVLVSGFEEAMTDQMSEKALPAMYAAAVGKVGIRFTKEDQPNLVDDSLKTHIDMQKKEIRSHTGELYWNYDKGYVTANTAKTQAAFGFLQNVPVELKDCAIRTDNTYATVLVSSWDDKPLAESKHVLVTATARSRNTDMAYSKNGCRLINIGTPPLRLEGVKGTLTLNRSGACKITPLSPYGYPVEAKIEAKVEGGKTVIPLNGSSKAYYYDIVFE